MIQIKGLPLSGADGPNSIGQMAADAERFLSAKSWCKRIVAGKWGVGWEGIVAVIQFEIEPAYNGVDESMWVIVGDLPPAYICNDNLSAK